MTLELNASDDRGIDVVKQVSCLWNILLGPVTGNQLFNDHLGNQGFRGYQDNLRVRVV
jgi:hypothetical protein